MEAEVAAQVGAELGSSRDRHTTEALQESGNRRLAGAPLTPLERPGNKQVNTNPAHVALEGAAGALGCAGLSPEITLDRIVAEPIANGDRGLIVSAPTDGIPRDTRRHESWTAIPVRRSPSSPALASSPSILVGPASGASHC